MKSDFFDWTDFVLNWMNCTTTRMKITLVHLWVSMFQKEKKNSFLWSGTSTVFWKSLDFPLITKILHLTFLLRGYLVIFALSSHNFLTHYQSHFVFLSKSIQFVAKSESGFINSNYYKTSIASFQIVRYFQEFYCLIEKSEVISSEGLK